MSRELQTGRPSPLGANWDGQGINFALFSEQAEKVELCLFDAGGKQEVERIELPGRSDDVWHGYLQNAGPGTVYGYRVHGPYDPDSGHRFNPHKLLLDPYARQITGAVDWCPAVYGYDLQDSDSDSSFDNADSAPHVPRAVVVDESFDWQDDHPPHIPWSQTVIYETHVRGFSKLHPQIDEAQRGSFAALASTPVIDYLKSLGVTSIELQPVHEFIDDHFLAARGLSNYWGYNSIGFFAPASRYLSDGNRNEFKRMVRQLHQAGIEVILDVVFNHTAEGNETGPTLCFRGIDNASYYRLPEENKRAYINDTGCGNTLNCNHPRVLQMVIDSLRHWVVDMHVDGFRFDLAVSLGREQHGFDNQSAFFLRLQEDAVLSQVKLIAEPWDIGPGGYQLGGFPPDWAEWNDRFRDTTRRFWRGDPGLLADFARGLHGSSELFEHNGRRPSASINFITSHDGFTLSDLVSYNERHNEANGESNLDGHSANFSNNYGVEGATEDPAILELRERQRRNFLATLLLAHGTPMLLAGDEMGRSQQGNNNAYCLDSELTWLDWSLLENHSGLQAMVKNLIGLRKNYAVLHRNRYLHDNRIDWLRADGRSMTGTDWHDPDRRFLAMLLKSPQYGPYQLSAEQATLILAFNAAPEAVEFSLPGARNHWYRVFSSGEDEADASAVSTLVLEARCVQVFASQPGAALESR